MERNEGIDNYSTGLDLRFGAHPKSATEIARAFSRLLNR